MATRRKGPARRRITANPSREPKTARRDGSVVGGGRRRAWAAQFWDARMTRASKRTLTWVARGIRRYLLVAGSEETRSRAEWPMPKGSHAPVMARVFAGGGGGLSYGSMPPGRPRTGRIGAGEIATTAATLV